MEQSEGGRVLDLSVPHSARVWNYWLGGKDNYVADRVAGDGFAKVYPEIVTLARQSRQFLARVVGQLVRETGIRQFLDIGTGLPAHQNTHDVALAIAPDARVVYVDNDPLVLAHARALGVHPGHTESVAHVDADVRDPVRLIADIAAELDLTRPVCVMFMGVLGYVEAYGEARRIVDAVLAAVPAGSYLALWDATSSAAFDIAQAEYNARAGEPYFLRGVAEIDGFFHGLEVVEPGVVPISEWRRERIDADIAVDGYGAVARKP